ncbi:inorganic triphosphatase [Erwinia pyrifoliae]|uniref:CYTH domain-containing protein n=1 Tax=Erwinia pyrifoliae TaxID=79967 RepID=UPI00019608B5|nr:CYTH domain-containing protein [Erwinia pyrifoliae]AUX73966.1 CYTH domain-containing protein [Erwinia pyrifoliae]MCA8875695.1 inorganic triphosphatase [Erwinia pyrifoliae]MCT2385900.1 inorganic triphosphatase [Erwinia pyrifoliae]MCU8588523.1 inorganic triphosphatase [Erwinia pyrifoliae]UXK12723.1 inorganic triphosphatase [Erwinia pyrifoliae]
MTIEIELKFIAAPEAATKVAAKLAAWPHQHVPGQKLTNIYFETDDNQLRRWDMGLRIRGFGDGYEMTLKTAGQTVGGLHQRPEYNVPLTQPELDIQRLPGEIWPAGTDVAALQQRLKVLFSTHFVREKWVVTYLQSEIEVAFDCGEVSAGALSEPLMEIELELKNGHRDDLLALATELAMLDGLRLGSLTKAARGYALAQGNPPRSLRPLPLLKARPKATVEEGMQAAFQLALGQWQYHEELWLRGHADALREVKDALETLRQAFSLYGVLVPRKASSDLRQKLTLLEEAMLDDNVKAETLCFSALWLQPQLALTNWLATARWREFVDSKADAKLQGSFKRFSDIMLGRIAADLKETFAQVNHAGEYQDKLMRLHRQLLAVHLLAGSYDAAAVNAWLQSWQQLGQAIDGQQDAWFEGHLRQALKQPAFWKNGSL